MNAIRFGTIAVVAVWALATPAGAQTSPSADQIINALKPSPQMLQGAPTRGIRPIAPNPGSDVAPISTAPRLPTTGATRPKAEPATARTEAPAVDLYVPFENGSAELTPAGIAALDELGKALTSSSLTGYRFRIEGHTDTVGTRDYNQSLSERRADAVSAYLEKKFGIAQDKLVVVGVGFEHLLVPTPPQTPEPRNRRVTVVNLGA